MKKFYRLFPLSILFYFVGSVQSNAQFTQGNLAVLSVGPGTTSSATALTIVEYTTAGVPTGYSVPLPSSGNPQITNSASATSEGEISLNGERNLIIVPGYDAPSGTASIAGTNVATYNRELFSVNASGTYAKLGVTSTLFNANNIRSGTTCGPIYYGSGANSGVVLMDNSNTVVSSTSANNRQLNIYNGQAYFTTASGTHGLWQVGNGIPNTTGQVSTNVINTGAASSNYGFVISPDGLTCYIADDGTGSPAAPGIFKYTRPNLASSFTLAYTLTTQSARGLTADFTTTPYTLYATTAANSPNSIFKVVDNGAGSTTSTLATAPATYVFRGIVFVPLTAPCMTLTPTVGNANCLGNGDSVNLSVSGYAANSFVWSGPGAYTATTQNISGLVPGTYTVVVTSLQGKTGCTVRTTATVSQGGAPTVTPSQTNVSCNGGNNGSATVAVSGGTPPYSYSWAPSGGTGATASNLTAGNYTCTINDNGGCTVTQSFTVNQPPLLISLISQTPVSCYSGSDGTATVFPSGGTAGYTYSWAPSGGTSATATSLAAGNYTCTITDANNCFITKSIAVTQPTALSATTSQTNLSCYAGSNGSATVNVTGGTPNYTYSWAPSGGTNPTANSLAAGSYTCTITDANNCVLTEAFLLTQPTQLTATTSQTNISCNGGTNGSATVYPTGGTPSYSYSWAPLGGTNATATGLPAGTYTCTITDANNCTNTQTVTITQASQMTASISGTTTICAGDSAVITFTATPNTTVSFTANAAPQSIGIPASGIATLTVVPGNTTTYSLVSIQDNTVNCTALVNGSATVTVNPVPSAPLTTDLAYCQYDLATALTATGQNLLWYTLPTGGIGNAAAPVPSTNTAATTTWYVTQSSLGCESPRSVLQVLVKPQPAAPTTLAQTQYCQDEQAMPLSAIGDSLLWYAAATGGLGSTNAPTPVTNATGTTTYYVTQTKNGCESPRLPIVITVTAKPQPPTVSDVTYCQNEAAIPLTAQGQNLLWYDVPTGGLSSTAAPVPSTNTASVSTWYVAQVVGGCISDRAAITVTVYEQPFAAVTSSAKTVCQNQALTFSFSGTAGLGANYTWTLPLGATIESGSGTGPVVIKFTQPGTNIVTLTVDAGNGKCPASASDTINVIALPEAGIEMQPAACSGDTVRIRIPVMSPGIADYQWNFAGGDLLRVPSAIDGTYWLRWTNPGIHTVTLTVISQQQCPSFTASADINIHQLPDASMADIVNNICANDTVQFAPATVHESYTYRWTPGQFFNVSSDSSVVKGIMEFSRDVTMTVYDEYGCESSNSKYISVKPCCEVYFPNAFTPNGDGRNDIFRPLAHGHHVYRLFKVINRWGQTVFNTANEVPNWDGSFGGVPQDPGVYFYFVRFECIDGKVVEQSGDVTLIR
jgi:gliding motility-associated-like protein